MATHVVRAQRYTPHGIIHLHVCGTSSQGVEADGPMVGEGPLCDACAASADGHVAIAS